MNFPDQLTCYKAIGAALSKAAPSGWSSIQADIVLSGSKVDAVVSYQAPTGSGHLVGVPMLARYFHELARLVSTEEKGLFKSCSFKLEQSGQYHTDFSY